MNIIGHALGTAIGTWLGCWIIFTYLNWRSDRLWEKIEKDRKERQKEFEKQINH